MKKLLLIVIAFFIAIPVFSQTPDEIRKEAYPEQTQTTDNSDYAKLLGKLTDAKKSGNQDAFNMYLNELNVKYGNKGNVTNSDRLPDNRNFFLPTMNQPVETGNLPDWANGENIIYAGTVGTSSSGNPRAFNRMLKIESDTMGVLFAGFLNSLKDTLFFYRSSNSGVSWTKIQAVAAGTASKYYSFDFALADTTGGFKIGIVVSITPASSLYQGTVYYADMLPNGTGFSPVTVFTPASGRGIVGPVICTDAYNWAPNLTYWYIAAQNCDATTGVTSFVPCAYSPNWGTAWVHDTARATYNDYELDIDYKSDTIYVLLTNNLTTTNENLRLRYVTLTNWGTNVAWSQYNPAGESFHEYNGCLAVNHKTSAMVVTYTTDESSNNNIKYTYAANGSTWVPHNILSNMSNNETRAYVHSLSQQAGAFRVVFCSSGSTLDSVIYMNTFDIASGFSSRTLVSRAHLSTGVLAPSLVGYMFNGTSAGAGVIYAGSGPANIWYNGSDLLTETAPISTVVPDRYILSQNYPNPFNPVTKIRFAVPKNAYATIKVFDITGKEVASLLGDYLNAGEYQVTFDGSKLTSGVYFYTFTSGNFSDTKKMILLK